MADRRHVIIKVFRKYGHSLGPESLEFLEDLLDRHDIADEEVEYSIEWMAQEYNKQDDAQMKVSLDVLQRVYETFQNGDNNEDEGHSQLDSDSHLFFIDAYEMPLWNWSVERSTFERAQGTLTASGSADSRVFAARNRLNVIKQCVLRNDHFSPSTLPSKDRQNLLTLKSTKQLLGRAGDRFLLFGMLTHSKEGKLCLEDQDGAVELDFSQLEQPSEGLFTEGCFALVEGDYTEDATLLVIAIGHPPCESREAARSIYGHIDFLGRGATTLLEDKQFASRVQLELPDLRFFVLSDVWLDKPDTLLGLRKMFDNCMENSFIPKVIVLCGNFTSVGIPQGNGRELRKYQDNFEALADLITSYPLLTRTTHFVLVPGPLDVTINSVLPRRPILSSFVSRLKSRVPNVHFASNPCRIKFFEQEIVIFREDLMSRMLRNLVGVKPDVKNDDLERYLVQTILDQSHLMPVTTSIQPTLSELDHALRLYPLPTAVVLADKYERYQMTYEGCHVFNPGRFVGNTFTFSAYAPARRESEECVLDLDPEEGWS
ncbi:epsilon DNA polymerase [Dichomitus squalens LYAD-421 SS1]|uniref:DNA polymerase epsilon subunit n=1 Tax=Dichomitus squalens (strain LYAD-421) TaxID=732165 RepID=R7SYQ6_DICSQ|nr:epsilon DNA polymerase [Dichomitus squalens LYAD-421 SS1]EJF61186.1 epsilon DNA polymerase [Dichomitus squalens LYAD-421 SS1]